MIFRADEEPEIPTLMGLLRERWLDKGQMEKLRALESHRERAQVCSVAGQGVEPLAREQNWNRWNKSKIHHGTDWTLFCLVAHPRSHPRLDRRSANCQTSDRECSMRRCTVDKRYPLNLRSGMENLTKVLSI